MAFVHLETYPSDGGEVVAIRCLACGSRTVILRIETDGECSNIVPSDTQPDMWCPMCGTPIQTDPEQWDDDDEEE